MLKRFTTYCLFLLFLLFSVPSVFSADLNTLSKEIIKPSPQAETIKKYMGSQPALSTGSVNIPISIYDLIYKDVKIPISLVYNTSGIKVDDDPFPVGYGWSILPGMRVSRTIQGRPDELFPLRTENDGNISDFCFYKSCVTEPKTGLNCYDSRHDIYTATLLQGNISFMLERNGGRWNVIRADNGGERIDTDSLLTKFTVTDTYGLKYVFGTPFETLHEIKYTTSWMLQSIILHNGDSINFSWKKSYHPFTNGNRFSSCTLVDNYSYNNQCENNIHETPNYTGSVENATFEKRGRHAAVCMISAIESPHSTIRFTYSYLDGNPVLSRISVYDYKDTCIKQADFTYDYESYESLLLKTIHLSNEGTYSFEYNPQRFVSSTAQDYWGYYNGENDNLSLVPKIQLRTREYLDGIYQYYTVNGGFGDADRSVDTLAMQANILTSVTYPTGGQTLYEYEPHHFIGKTPYKTEVNPETNPALNIGGGLRVKRITTIPCNNGASVVKEYRYGPNESGLANSIAEPTLDTFVSAYQTFEPDCQGFQKKICTYRILSINTSSNYLEERIGETPIWYSEVAEYSREGKIVYTFDKKVAGNQCNNTFGSIIPITQSCLFSKGILPVSETIYKCIDGKYIPVNKHITEYSWRSSESLVDLSVERNCISTLGGPDDPDFTFDQNGYVSCSASPGVLAVDLDSSTIYSGYKCHINVNSEIKSAEYIIEYTDRDSIVTSINYAYLPENSSILRNKKIYRGTSSISETYFYPHTDDSDSYAPDKELLDEIINSNRIGYPFKITTKRGDCESSSITRFELFFGKLILPKEELFNQGEKTICFREFDYDSRGNKCSIKYAGDVDEIYLWGHNGYYPMIFASGISYDEAVVLLGGTSAILGLNGETPEASAEIIWSSLKNKSIVNCYGYIPLVGIDRHFDPLGKIKRYSYNSAHLLSSISVDNHGVSDRFLYNINTLAFTDKLSGLSISSENNYILHRQLCDAIGNSYIDNITYHDGLGRPIQNILKSITPDSQDLVSVIKYDENGRKYSETLKAPIATNGNQQSIESIYGALSDYYEESAYDYITTYEQSPRSEALALYGPGDAWRNKDIKTTYCKEINSASGDLGCINFSFNGTESVVNNGYFPPGMLSVKRIIDEDNRVSLEFTNLYGETVLIRRVLSNDVYADTYFIYDDYGYLRIVLSPNASNLLSSPGTYSLDDDVFQEFAFIYSYDIWGNILERKIPGSDPEEFVYDASGKLVFSRTGNQRTSGEWTLTLHDRNRRVVFTGNVANPDISAYADKVLTATYTGETDSLGGYKTNYPLPSGIVPEFINYYDNYDFINHLPYDIQSQIAFVNDADYDSYNVYPNSLATGNRIYYLDDSGNFSVSASFFNDFGKVVQHRRSNHLGGIVTENYAYDYRLNPVRKKIVTTAPQGETCDEYNYTYDHAGRMLSITLDHNGEGTKLVQNDSYDALGRLSTRTFNGSALTIPVSYSYNIRGWITGITAQASGKTFRQELRYTDGVIPQYGGNISEMLWDSDGNAYRKYTYHYDGLNHLTEATYSEEFRTNALAGLEEVPDYSVNYTFDLNSNIIALTRNGIAYKDAVDDNTDYWGFGVIDDLEMTHQGNRVVAVTDYAESPQYSGAPDFVDDVEEDEEYGYDANGNLIFDLNRGIEKIEYNHINLPRRIYFADGHLTEYTYDASGKKLRVVYMTETPAVVITPGIGILSAADGDPPSSLISGIEQPLDSIYESSGRYTVISTRDYAGVNIYKNDSIEMTLTDVGYISSGTHYYYIKDYQGNIRWVVNDRAGVVQINDYYPYGATFGNTTFASVGNTYTSSQSFKYGGKEFDSVNGLQLYDFHARMLDPQMGLFTSPDPRATDYPHIAPHAYCAGNPILYIDQNGEWLETVWDALSFTDGIVSCVKNLTAGNYKAAAVDGVGALYDLAATLTPGLPGGASKVISATRAADKAIDATKTYVKLEKHHIIPKKLLKNSIVQQAIKEGFNINDINNFIELTKYSKATGKGIHGNHPKYSDTIAKIINDQQNGSAREKVEYVMSTIKQAFIDGKFNGIKVNDLTEQLYKLFNK